MRKRKEKLNYVPADIRLDPPKEKRKPAPPGEDFAAQLAAMLQAEMGDSRAPAPSQAVRQDPEEKLDGKALLSAVSAALEQPLSVRAEEKNPGPDPAVKSQAMDALDEAKPAPEPWSDEKLLAAVDAILARPIFAAAPAPDTAKTEPSVPAANPQQEETASPGALRESDSDSETPDEQELRPTRIGARPSEAPQPADREPEVFADAAEPGPTERKPAGSHAGDNPPEPDAMQMTWDELPSLEALFRRSEYTEAAKAENTRPEKQPAAIPSALGDKPPDSDGPQSHAAEPQEAEIPPQGMEEAHLPAPDQDRPVGLRRRMTDWLRRMAQPPVQTPETATDGEAADADPSSTPATDAPKGGNVSSELPPPARKEEAAAAELSEAASLTADPVSPKKTEDRAADAEPDQPAAQEEPDREREADEETKPEPELLEKPGTQASEPDFLTLLSDLDARLELELRADAPRPGTPPADVPAELQLPMLQDNSFEQTAMSIPSEPIRAGRKEEQPTEEQPDIPAPEQTPRPKPRAAQKQERRQWGRRRDRLAPVEMTVEDFLAAAVPAENAADQKRPARERDPLFAQPEPPRQISTVPENPEGLTPSVPSEKKNRSSAPRQEILPSAPQPSQEQTASATDTVVSASARSRHAEPEASAGKPWEKPRETEVSQNSPRAFQETLRAEADEETDPDRRQAWKRRGKEQREPEDRTGNSARERKLPESPEDAERRYSAGLNAVTTRLILTGIFTAVSLFFTLYLSMDWTFLPEVFSGGSTAYLLLLLLAAIVLSNLKEFGAALREIGEGRFPPILLLLPAAIFTGLDAINAAQSVRAPFTSVIGGLLLLYLWGRYDRLAALLRTVKVLRDEPLSAGVSEVQDITKGSRGLIRTEPEPERFMQLLETRDACERAMGIYTPIALLSGLTITLLVTLGLKQDLFWTGSLVFIGSMPVTALLSFPRLFRLVSQRLAESHSALCGYHGAEVFGGEHAILIGDDDIFPPGSLSLNGFKVYDGSPDRIIAYAAAATRRSGSALAPVFDDLLTTHNGRHYSVDSFRFYDSGGIGAVIQDDVTLLGSLDFMRRMGVHMDPGAKVRQAVYVSVNGELAAVFAVRYAPPENIRRGLASIAGNRHFKGILVTRTFLGTPGFLKAKFGVPNGAFEYPTTRERLRLSEAELKNSGAQGAILARDSFTGFAQAAAGGRMLRSASVLAAVLSVLSGILSLLLMGILAALPAYETATAVNVLLYMAAWLVPTLLLTAWARHF